MDGAALNVSDFVDSMLEGDADGGQLLAFLGEDLDALVVGPGAACIVGDFFAIKIDGGGSGGLGVVGHLQFFGGGLLELGTQMGWGCEDGEAERETERQFRELHGWAF
jgi:hypothetical protein